MKKKKICVITGTRAEFGLLINLMNLFKESPDFELQIIVTGMHLSKKFGETVTEIREAGFVIDREVDLSLDSDTPAGVTKSTGIGMIGFADAYESLKPDLVLLLGDRFEVLAAATAAMFARIPLAHLHGGELTEGALDDSIRHAVTKFSNLHFVASEEYRRRVIQLGEIPSSVFNVGGLGVDAIGKLQLFSKAELELQLGIRFRSRNLLITFHPATAEKDHPEEQMSELLGALSTLDDATLIFTMPNADAGGSVIQRMIEDFVVGRDHAHAFKSLGQRRYLSCIAQVDCVIGNSSSGLCEVPTFKKPTIDIGDRQKGRLRATSVIHCDVSKAAIVEAIKKAYSPGFRDTLDSVRNPYGEGGASERILEVIRGVDFEALGKKVFYDLPVPAV